MAYWLMKSEPSEYSIDHLMRDGSSSWYGVRNYLARNYMRDHMQIGERVFFYHSSCPVPGIYGIAEVVSLPHPDETQFMIGDKHSDPKATREKPIWHCVDVGFVQKFLQPITLSEIRMTPELATMKILERGNRLSITPVSEEEWSSIMNLITGR